MKRSILFFAFCFFLTIGLAQNPLLPEGTPLFPISWVGIWTGDLEIFSEAGLTQTIPMELDILPTDTVGIYTWTLIYGEDKVAGKRDYLLRTVDKNKGHYLIDERNSIAMEAYYFANKLFNRFEVMGSLILVTTELRDKQLYFEVISGKMTAVSTSGGQRVMEEEIPPVQAFPIGGMQRAVLARE